MPRFPVAFNRRKSTADNLDNAAVAGPSFRVLDRSEVASGSKNFDAASGARRTVKSQSMPNTLMAVEPEDDNIFANISINRNVSTAPSSADLNTQQQHQQFQQQFHQQQQQQHQQEDYRLQKKQLYSDVPVPPIPKSSTTGSFFKSAGRTFSFGSQKKHVPMVSDERAPQTPPNGSTTGRDRSTTASTVTTATPPRLEDEVALDLGGDFSRMLGGGFDKRTSIMTVRDEGASRPALASRTSSGNRLNNSTLAQVDDAAKFEHSPYPESRQNSNERLLNSNALLSTSTDENFPPTVPRHGSPSDRPQTSSGGTPSVPQHSVGSIPTSLTDSNLKRSTARFGRRRSTIDNAAEDVEDEDAALLKDSLLTAQRFLAGSEPANSARSSLPSSRFGRDGLAVGYSQLPTESTSPAPGNKAVTADENMFDINLDQPSRVGQRFVAHKPTPSQNKVMTPAQFERYRKDKEREDGSRYSRMIQPDEKGSDEDEDNYEDEEDEVEKSRQAAKQRRKQLAHMTIYRQQMMKVTGEAASGPPARSSMHFSMSTPNLPVLGTLPQIESEAGPEDDDEEVPLAILAAHGFPNRNRPPTRLSTMMSNPSLHAAANPSYQRPQSVIGGDATAAASNVRLPVFARNLPQDPYGLINSNKRETFNLAGGAPAPMQQANGGGLAPGGLVGVIASEERSRAMRRGSPNMEAANRPLSNLMGQQFDPAAGIPSQMMYPGMDMHGQGQNQMAQQLQQFMQMQMQFMQMMASGGGNSMQRPMGGPMNMGMAGGRNNDMARHSFMDNGSVMDMQLPRPDAHMRTMSMVQPSSASWLPQPHMSAYAPSIRIQGANGYASSLAPSERSNVGLPGRYRPVSQAPAGPAASDLRKSMAVSGTLGSGVGNSQTSATTTPRPNTSGSASPNGSHANTRGPSPAGWDLSREQKSSSPLHNVTNAADDDDDEEGWAAMKTKRDKKRSLWKSKKSLSSDFGALFS
ncbi:hypothetical protein SEPCBS119000_001628 [Sporothrix epigloea]|uniref:Uncharacterized protein n=1 Tax=Sporothrix epigloea TaxID=1892477 RepID=A0ABP0DCY7_9PEZI